MRPDQGGALAGAVGAHASPLRDAGRPEPSRAPDAPVEADASMPRSVLSPAPEVRGARPPARKTPHTSPRRGAQAGDAGRAAPRRSRARWGGRLQVGSSTATERGSRPTLRIGAAEAALAARGSAPTAWIPAARRRAPTSAARRVPTPARLHREVMDEAAPVPPRQHPPPPARSWAFQAAYPTTAPEPPPATIAATSSLAGRPRREAASASASRPERHVPGPAAACRD